MSEQVRALFLKTFPHGKASATHGRANDIYGRAPGQSLVFDFVAGTWSDRATTQSGSTIESLYAERGDLPEHRAEVLAAQESLEGHGARGVLVPIRKDVLVGDMVPPSRTRHPKHGKPSACYWYRSLTGLYMAGALRFDLEDGNKTGRYLVALSTPGAPSTWHWRGNLGPSGLLYNAMDLLHPDKSSMQVLVVEGEKTAEALVGAASAVVTTWSGGSKCAGMAGWHELRGRDVILCPDYDAPGIAAMELIANILRGYGCKVRIVAGEAVASALGIHTPKEGWDVGDAEREPEVIARAILDEAERTLPPPDIPLFFLSDRGVPKPTAANALLAMEGADELGIVFNDDLKVPGYRACPPWRGGGGGFDPMKDVDVIRLTHFLRNKHGVDFPRSGVLEGYLAVAATSHFSPWRDYLNGLEWDHELRIDNLLDLIGCKTPDFGEEAEYLSFGTAYMFCGVVARVLQPGIQMDMMPVLEGRQNIGKSKLIKVMAGQFSEGVDPSSYVSLDLGLMAGKGFGQKDAQMAVAGAILVEVEELAQIEATDVNVMKRFISLQVDVFRPPYGANMVTYKRQCMLIGTTNRKDYLRDDTGNRRFLPIHMECRAEGIDIEWLIEHRDQLFAEAVHRFREHEAAGTLQAILDLPPGMRAFHERTTNDRFVEEPWVETLRDYFLSNKVKLEPGGLISASDILESVFNIEPRNHNAKNFTLLKKALVQMGAEHVTQRERGGRRSMYKIPPKSELGTPKTELAARGHVEGGSAGGFDDMDDDPLGGGTRDGG